MIRTDFNNYAKKYYFLYVNDFIFQVLEYKLQVLEYKLQDLEYKLQALQYKKRNKEKKVLAGSLRNHQPEL